MSTGYKDLMYVEKNQKMFEDTLIPRLSSLPLLMDICITSGNYSVANKLFSLQNCHDDADGLLHLIC